MELTGLLFSCQRSTERHLPYSLQAKQIAVQIEQFAQARAVRLTAAQISSILRGLTGANHEMSPDALKALAAVLMANDCQRLQLASEHDIKHIVWSFSMQVSLHTVECMHCRHNQNACEKINCQALPSSVCA